MRCTNCGYEIPDGELYCKRCGREIRIVPDYNPLDDVLAAQVKGGIDGGERPLDDYDYEQSYTSDLRRGEAQRAERRKKEQTRSMRHTSAMSGKTARTSGTGRVSRGTGTAGKRVSQGTGNMNPDRERRRRMAEKKREKKKRLRRKIIIGFIILIAALAAAVFFLYRNSYAGQIRQGNRAFSEGNYEEAENFFNRAVDKDPKRGEAYTALSKVYLARDDEDGAEELFLNALESYPDEVPVYEACIAFYVDTEQPQEVSAILEDAPEDVRSELSEYVSEGPTFSLDDSEVFDDVQQLSLESDGEVIYYTTDGSDPDTSSQKYSEPIQIPEGTTTVSAISVNAAGIPSLPVVKEYTVEFPIEDAPAVTPSTGQYEQQTQIVIQVPEGYTAYYTMDKSDPTEKSTKYTGPIDMPEGNTIFKAVLVNGKGRLTGVTTRNYELVLN